MGASNIEILKNKFKFLSDVDKNTEQQFNQYITKKILTKGMILQSDNNDCQGIPIVSTGIMRLFKSSPHGREMTIYRVKEGEMCILAAVCLTTDIDYEFTAEAENDCELYIIHTKFYRHLVNTNETFRNYVVYELSKKLTDTMTLVEQVHFNDVTSKLIKYLNDNEVNGSVKATHESIAFDIGTSREAVTRELSKLKKQGKIELSYKKISILKKL